LIRVVFHNAFARSTSALKWQPQRGNHDAAPPAQPRNKLEILHDVYFCEPTHFSERVHEAEMTVIEHTDRGAHFQFSDAIQGKGQIAIRLHA